MRRGWSIAVGILAVVAAAVAQDDKPKPPAGGESIPAGFRAFIAVDDRYPPKGKEADPRNRSQKMHDLVVEHGLNPTVAIFTRTAPAEGDPAAKLAKQLDPLVTTHRGNSFGVYLVHLTLDKEYPDDDMRDAKAQAVKDLAAQLKAPKVAYGLAATKSAQVDAWKLGDSDAVVVLYHRMKVIGRWPAPGAQLNDADIAAIVAAANKEGAGN